MTVLDTLPRRLRVAALLAVSTLVFSATGCSDDDGAPGDAFAQQVDEVLASARDDDVSDGQLDALETAREQGVMSLELMRERTRAAIDCMTEAGVTAQYDEREKTGGVLVPVYLAQIGADSPATDGVTQDERLVEQCDTEEFYWVNKLYLTQPTSVQAQQRSIELRAPEIRSCLEAAGYPPDAGATAAELDQQALSVLSETEGEVDCVVGSGL